MYDQKVEVKCGADVVSHQNIGGAINQSGRTGRNVSEGYACNNSPAPNSQEGPAVKFSQRAARPDDDARPGPTIVNAPCSPAIRLAPVFVATSRSGQFADINRCHLKVELIEE